MDKEILERAIDINRKIVELTNDKDYFQRELELLSDRDIENAVVAYDYISQKSKYTQEITLDGHEKYTIIVIDAIISELNEKIKDLEEQFAAL
ncbi:hypothetical protein [Proteiniphilum acetatigenes]|uniref:hypothetical protein n=1 Tax=Proteiniphilum acetatigenes TaxID=294710 RepID=UPI00037FCE23|nr:hypothetical protein [Proteiniphilum acetatigenes]